MIRSLLFEDVHSNLARENNWRTGRNFYTALSAVSHAGLDFKLFPMPQDLDPFGEEFIPFCCEYTGTSSSEQLCFSLCSDSSTNPDKIVRNVQRLREDPRYPNIDQILETEIFPVAAIGVVPYGTLVNPKKIVSALQGDNHSQRFVRGVRTNKFSSNGADPNDCGFDSGLVSFDADPVYHPRFVPAHPPDYDYYIDGVLTPYAVDSSIRDLRKICFPVGRRFQGSALALVSSRDGLSLGTKLDEFLRSYISPCNIFVIADIKK